MATGALPQTALNELAMISMALRFREKSPKMGKEERTRKGERKTKEERGR